MLKKYPLVICLSLGLSACPLPGEILPPASQPTAAPTAEPLPMPTAPPSVQPTPVPSATPTAQATPVPTATPTVEATPVPTATATPVPEPGVSPEPSPGVTVPEVSVLFENHNILAVQNQPLNPTTFTLGQSARITDLETYHWNSAQGKPGGSIGLRAADGTLYGPWPVSTRPGQGGVPNAYWLAEPNQDLPAGTYTVLDSDPASWAHNSANGNRGMTQVKGYLLESTEPILPEPGQWGEEQEIFSNHNILAVQNTPISPTRFTLTQTTQLTYLETYHWNNAQGSPGGTLALLDSKGKYYGPWPVSTRSGQGNVPNAYWYVELSLILPPETYTVVDSDSVTWSHNSANGNQGMTLIKGREADRGVPQS